MKDNKLGFRGYIGSRHYYSGAYPQQLQNLLIRHYCQRYQLTYLLSATEYAMPGCYMMLEEVLSSLDQIDGIVLFSLFMLPTSAEQRQRIYKKILDSGCVLHAALEDLSIKNVTDTKAIEDIWNLKKIIATDESIRQILNLKTQKACYLKQKDVVF